MISAPMQDALDHVERTGVDPAADQLPPRQSRQQQRQDDDEAAPRNAPRIVGEPADDDDEQDLERTVEIEAVRLDRPQIGEGPQNAGDADDERMKRRRPSSLARKDRHADDAAAVS